MIGRPSTRDIAIETQAMMTAHAAQHAADIADVRQNLALQEADRRAMFSNNQATVAANHAENKSLTASVRTEMNGLGERLHARIDRIDARFNGLQWGIIGSACALITTLIGVTLSLIKLPVSLP